MVLRVIQGERLRVDDVRLVVARQRVGAVEGLAIAIGVVVLISSLELFDTTWLRQNGKVHVLVSCQVGTAVLRPGEENLTGRFVDTQVLRTARRYRIRSADELAVAVVGFHDHAGHRVVRAFALHSRNVDLTDLGFFARDDHVLLERLPRDCDRVTFDVLARPRVYNSAETGVGTLRSFQAVRVVFRVVPLPGVTHRVSGTSFCELLDLRIGEIREKVQVSLAAGRINGDAFVSLVGNVLAKEGLTDIHGGHLAGIQDAAKKTRIGEKPIGECAILRVVEGEAQAPQGFVGAGRTRLQGTPAKTSLTAARSAFIDNTRAGRQVGSLLGVLLHCAGLVADAAAQRGSYRLRLRRDKIRSNSNRATN